MNLADSPESRHYPQVDSVRMDRRFIDAPQSGGDEQSLLTLKV